MTTPEASAEASAALLERLTHNIETQRVLIGSQAMGSVEREAARTAYAVMLDARSAIISARAAQGTAA